jgi:hypothetical protein
VKTDIDLLQLADIDEFYLKDTTIHCVGGQFGEVLLMLSTIFNNYGIPDEKRFNIIDSFFEDYLLSLNDFQLFEMIYLESQRFDFKDISDDRREEFMQFLMEDRRYINKSIKRLLELGHIDNMLYERTKKCIANILLALPQDVNTIEVDPENDTPEYLQGIEKQKADIGLFNEKLEKLKKKIKITCVKGEMLKNKRNNMCGFITIHPASEMRKEFTVIDIPEEEKKPEPIKEEPKAIAELEGVQDGAEINELGDNEGGDNGNIEAVNVEPQPSEPKPEETIVQQPEEEKPKRIIILTLAEPIITTFDYLNEAILFRNAALATDAYVIHKDLTDHYKLAITKAIFFTLKKFGVKVDIKDAYEMVKMEYNRLSDLLVNDIMKNENYKGGKLINIDIVPEVSKTEENVEISGQPDNS